MIQATAKTIVACIKIEVAGLVKTLIRVSYVGIGFSLCGVINIKYIKKITLVHPAPRDARKYRGL